MERISLPLPPQCQAEGSQDKRACDDFMRLQLSSRMGHPGGGGGNQDSHGLERERGQEMMRSHSYSMRHITPTARLPHFTSPGSVCPVSPLPVHVTCSAPRYQA